jgi:hypothetical protein
VAAHGKVRIEEQLGGMPQHDPGDDNQAFADRIGQPAFPHIGNGLGQGEQQGDDQQANEETAASVLEQGAKFLGEFALPALKMEMDGLGHLGFPVGIGGGNREIQMKT